MKITFKKALIVIFLGLIIFGFMGYKALMIPNLQDESTTITINIPSGSSSISIAEKLTRANLISNANWFRIYTLITKKDREIKSGVYKIKGGWNLIEIVEYLINNNQEVYHHPNKITIPEGLTLEELEKKFLDNKLGTKIEINKLFNDQAFIKEQLGIKVSSLEGFIYPSTYFYEDDLSFKEFLIKYPLTEFKKAYSDFISDPSFYKQLILASIVEKESGSSQEKPIVASVFNNRLTKQMPLQSCATHNKIFFQRGQRPPKQLLNIHLEIDSPYNTYKNSGLPPTPICSPAKDSFDAVLANHKTDYLYFFADFQGNNIFSKTYNEHNSKKKSYWTNNKIR